jgi:hypothetical protein
MSQELTVEVLEKEIKRSPLFTGGLFPILEPTFVDGTDFTFVATYWKKTKDSIEVESRDCLKGQSIEDTIEISVAPPTKIEAVIPSLVELIQNKIFRKAHEILRRDIPVNKSVACSGDINQCSVNYMRSISGNLEERIFLTDQRSMTDFYCWDRDPRSLGILPFGIRGINEGAHCYESVMFAPGTVSFFLKITNIKQCSPNGYRINFEYAVERTKYDETDEGVTQLSLYQCS